MHGGKPFLGAVWGGGPPLPKIPIDPNGNLAAKTEGTDTWTYTWNAENQLTKVEKNGAEVARFAYDPLGRRVEKIAGGVTTTYVFDGSSTLREVRGSTILKYVGGTGVDEPLAVDDGTVLSHFHADGLGSIVKVTNAAGAVTLTRQYDTWGGLEVGASETGFAFTGREWDPEVRLYYYRARYYEAGIGRFVSEDPIRFRGGINFYAYAANGPATAVDPSGLKVQKCCRPVGGNPILSRVARAAGVPHCFMKTDTQAGGMGQADPNDPKAEGLCPIGTQTRINPPPPSDIATAKCEDVPCVEESCVDIILRTRPHTGPWGRHNNCNTVVDMIIKACRKNTPECRCEK